MTLADLLQSLFGPAHPLSGPQAVLAGRATLPGYGPCHVVGYTGGHPLGVDEAIVLAKHVLAVANSGDQAPLLVLVDASSQRMSRRDELLGLSEYLAHLAKALLFAERCGHRTVGLLYGGAAAGAFIATALACSTLVALPGASPTVMDLPSMARVTKLPLEVLKQKAATTPVFAPGLDNFAKLGGVSETWDPQKSLAEQLVALLAKPAVADLRGELGQTRGGRLKAKQIADEVARLAVQHG